MIYLIAGLLSIRIALNQSLDNVNVVYIPLFFTTGTGKITY